MSKHTRCCKDCKAKCNDDFKKITELNRSGLVIFMYKKKLEESVQKTPSITSGNDTVVLYNPTDRDLKRPIYINELCQYRTNCLKCGMLVQKVRNLLNEIKDIRKNETVAVCDYCKHSSSNRCKRCEYIVHKFMNDRIKQYEQCQESVRLWLSSIQLLLQSLLEKGAVWRHCSNLDFSVLEEFIKELKPPLPMRRTDIDIFSILGKLMSTGNLEENKDCIEEILRMIQYIQKSTSDERIFNFRRTSSTTYANKNLEDVLFQNNLSTELKPQKHDISDGRLLNKEGVINASEFEHGKIIKEMNKENNASKGTFLPDSMAELRKEQKKPLDKAAHKVKILTNSNRKIKTDNKEKSVMKKQATSSSDIKETLHTKKLPPEDITIKPIKIKENVAESSYIIPMIKKARQKNNEKTKKDTMIPAIIIPKTADLPLPVHLEVSESFESGSVVECPKITYTNKEMIRGEEIVNDDHNYKNEYIAKVKSMVHEIHTNHATDMLSITDSPTMPTNYISPRDSGIHNSKTTPIQKNMEEYGKGIIKYKLSNPEFIEKGWTQLPTTKIMRRMNIYKTLPSHPQFNWFIRNMNKRIMYYATGEKLAEIGIDGYGRWYYRNGRIALDYYSAQETNIDSRYILYSDGEKYIGQPSTRTVLGAFDTLGNGVVYDLFGNERLKYNQSEGMLIDEKLGPPGRWKWNSLNDPPDLKSLFVDTYAKHTKSFIDLLREQNSQETNNHMKETQSEMRDIEIQNVLKEKQHKLQQKFSSFHIKTKILKLNRQFSLRIIDQANIYLRFNEGRTSLKLNIGTLLINNEILDTEIGEESILMTPYDRPIPKSESVVQIQRLIRNAGKLSKSKSCHKKLN